MIINIIISIVLGIMTTIVMFYFFDMRNNILYHGPNSRDIKSKIYKTKDKKCYVLKPKLCLCPI